MIAATRCLRRTVSSAGSVRMFLSQAGFKTSATLASAADRAIDISLPETSDGLKSVRTGKKYNESDQHSGARNQSNFIEFMSLDDAIEWIELSNYVTSYNTKRALLFLQKESFDPSSLSDEQKAILIRTCGEQCWPVSPRDRHGNMKRIFGFLCRNGSKFGIAAANAILDVKIDNNLKTNSIEALKWIESIGLKPNSETFGIISRIYARQGDVVAISKIVEHMNTLGLPKTQQIFDSLVYALCITDKNERALKLIEEPIGNSSIDTMKLRTVYAYANAKRLNVREMSQIFDGHFPRNASYSNCKMLLDALIWLVKRRCEEGVEKLFLYIRNMTLYNRTLESFSQAYILCSISSLLDSWKDMQSVVRLSKFLNLNNYAKFKDSFNIRYRMLLRNDEDMRLDGVEISSMDGVKISSMDATEINRAKLLDEESLQLTKQTMDCMLSSENYDTFRSLHQIYIESADFRKYGDRSSAKLCEIAFLISKLNDVNDGGVRVFSRILSEFLTMKFASDYISDRFLEYYFINPIINDSSFLCMIGDIFDGVDRDHPTAKLIVSKIFNRLVDLKRFNNLMEILSSGTWSDVFCSTSLCDGLIVRLFEHSAKDNALRDIASKLLRLKSRDSNEHNNAITIAAHILKVSSSATIGELLNQWLLVDGNAVHLTAPDKQLLIDMIIQKNIDSELRSKYVNMLKNVHKMRILPPTEQIIDYFNQNNGEKIREAVQIITEDPSVVSDVLLRLNGNKSSLALAVKLILEKLIAAGDVNQLKQLLNSECGSVIIECPATDQFILKSMKNHKLFQAGQNIIFHMLAAKYERPETRPKALELTLKMLKNVEKNSIRRLINELFVNHGIAISTSERNDLVNLISQRLSGTEMATKGYSELLDSAIDESIVLNFEYWMNEKDTDSVLHEAKRINSLMLYSIALHKLLREQASSDFNLIRSIYNNICVRTRNFSRKLKFLQKMKSCEEGESPRYRTIQVAAGLSIVSNLLDAQKLKSAYELLAKLDLSADDCMLEFTYEFLLFPIPWDSHTLTEWLKKRFKSGRFNDALDRAGAQHFRNSVINGNIERCLAYAKSSSSLALYDHFVLLKEIIENGDMAMLDAAVTNCCDKFGKVSGLSAFAINLLLRDKKDQALEVLESIHTTFPRSFMVSLDSQSFGMNEKIIQKSMTDVRGSDGSSFLSLLIDNLLQYYRANGMKAELMQLKDDLCKNSVSDQI